jgi:hypothetical protein
MADIHRKTEFFRRMARLKEGKTAGKHQGSGNSLNNKPIGHACREFLAFDPRADKKKSAEAGNYNCPVPHRVLPDGHCPGISQIVSIAFFAVKIKEFPSGLFFAPAAVADTR